MNITDTPTLPRYVPESGSIADRVLQLFIRNPDEYLSSADIALKFDVRSASVHASLAGAVAAGLLVFGFAEGESHKTWRAGPMFGLWAAARSGAVDPKQLRIAPRLPVDPLGVRIQKGVPVPTRDQTSRYALLWSRMEPGDMVELPRRSAMSFYSWSKKAGVKMLVRVLRPGVTGCWRQS